MALMQAYGVNAGNCAYPKEPLLVPRWEGACDYLSISQCGHTDPVTLLLHAHSHTTRLKYIFVT